ncbi:hypothetical protein MES5069_1740001 [Mesorhizobium escarrei]|uniref:Transposase IS801/IS1294 domain-containing protein n=1 Tax=Mesorhizobium escarrei TaxID=666018 RepID=A0ABN8JHJ7_9HYPH|nr:hypothetical protein MES5069_1740001 [Mesorhizobium escarrei]
MVYAKPPFAGPEAVLAYLSRYTHRVAISNRRLIRLDESGVTFRYKDYRREGADRQQHPSVPAPCPAAWLPSHPPLWPARRLRPQGQPRTRARTARGRASRHKRSIG